jgi:phosphate transport system substrate-binding protein
MVNKDGKKVEPTVAAFQSAASNAKWSEANGYYEVLTDEPGAESWPLTAATFILMYKEPVDKAASAEALKFFDWAFASGGKIAEDLDYIPMPAAVVTQIKATWASQIKTK